MPASRQTPRPAERPRYAAMLLTAACVAMLSGCALLPDATPDIGDEPIAPLEADFARSRLIVDDVVGTLVQLPTLSPRRTTLIADIPGSRFGELLIAALQDAGYDLRIGSIDATAGPVRWTIEPSREAGAGVDDWTVIVAAREVRVKRSYRADAAGVRPVSSMFVHGADASRVTVDRTLFERTPRRPVARSAPSLRASASSAANEARSPVSVTPLPAVRAAERVQATDTTIAARTPAMDSKPPSNMFESGISRYAPVFATFAPLEQRVMVFGNDSLVMGRENKRMARTMAERFDPARDVISVIGCSHGNTALQNGNETLANGRSWRVKDEFVRAGIDESLVLEEGCWAGVGHSKMPARGVLVTHRRRAG